MELKYVCFLVGLIGLGVVAEEEQGKSMVNLGKDAFDTDVAKKPHFVKFYAPWCGHCKNLAPTWEELAVKYNDVDEPEVIIAKVDCTVETALCSAQDVTGYPTLKFFKSGADSGVKHRAGRDKDSLVAFIDEQMGRGPAKEPTKKEEDDEKLVEEPEIAVADEGLFVLGEKSFAKHIEKGSHFIKFYAPWCGHCKKMAPAWEELAKDCDDDKKVSTQIAKVDCIAHQSICQEQEVRGYPTIIFFRDGQKVENYRGGRTFRELKDFVISMQKEKDTGPKEADGFSGLSEDNAVPVTVLDADTFEAGIKSGVVFVKFFAPWCGHCKKVAPIWDELAAKYADDDFVTIAKVDCTSDGNKNKALCDREGVKGFPTLMIYRYGRRTMEYSGRRGVDELSEFVKRHSNKEFIKEDVKEDVKEDKKKEKEEL